MLDIEKTTEGDIVVLALKGQLDALTAGKIKPVLDEVLDGDQVRVIYDLKELSLLDSSGIGVIVSTFKRTRVSGGDTKVACLSEQPKEVFTVLSLDRYIDTFDTLDEALMRFRHR